MSNELVHSAADCSQMESWQAWMWKTMATSSLFTTLLVNLGCG